MKRLIVLLLLVLVGCNLLPGGGKNDIDVDYTQINKGKVGLDISTIDKAPPKRIPENQNFAVLAKLHNKGKIDITKGVLVLIIDEVNMESLSPVRQNFELEGKNLFNVEGEMDIYGFDVTTKNIDEHMGATHDVELLLTAYYPYKTEVEAGVCVDYDLYGINIGNKEKPCKLDKVTMGRSGQGAPVMISSIEPNYKTQDGKTIPQYDIYIENTGGGRVFNLGLFEKVSSATAFSEEDQVWDIMTISASLSEEPLKCSTGGLFPDGTMQLVEDAENFITCSKTGPADSAEPAFTSPLTINLEYGYMNSYSQNVEII